MSFMQKKPQISVILSVYNCEKYLSPAIDSIIKQQFTDYELIIVNDGSTDNSLTIINNYVNNNKKLFLINNEQNIGLTKSLNIALTKAKGKYIVRQDSDDISTMDRLQKQFDFLEANPTHALVGCNRQDIDEEGKTIIKRFHVSNDVNIRETLFRSNPFVHGSLMIRRDAMNQVGCYNEKIKYAQDYDLILRIAEKFKIHILPDHLYKLRILDSSISRSKIIDQDKFKTLVIKMSEERRDGKPVDFDHWFNKIISKEVSPLKTFYFIRKKQAQWNLSYGKNFLLNDDIYKARCSFFKSFILLPSFKSSIFFMLTFFSKLYNLYNNKKRGVST